MFIYSQFPPLNHWNLSLSLKYPFVTNRFCYFQVTQPKPTYHWMPWMSYHLFIASNQKLVIELLMLSHKWLNPKTTYIQLIFLKTNHIVFMSNKTWPFCDLLKGTLIIIVTRTSHSSIIILTRTSHSISMGSILSNYLFHVSQINNISTETITIGINTLSSLNSSFSWTLALTKIETSSK